MCSVNVLSSILNQLKVKIQPCYFPLMQFFLLHSRFILSFSSEEEEEEEEEEHNWVFSADQMVVGGGGNASFYTLRPILRFDYHHGCMSTFVFCVVQRKKTANGQYLRARRV